MNAKLYVGNLSETTTEDTLWSLFSESGTVVSVDLIRDRISLRSKGYAFIIMGDQTVAERAIEMYDGMNVDGSEIHVSFAHHS
jgi:RNA recognition motif-containing protein